MKPVRCRARRAVAARLAAAAAMAMALSPFQAAATSVKHLERWTLGFARDVAELQPVHRRDLVLLAASIERHCQAGPPGRALLVVQTVQPRGGPDAARETLARDRRLNVQSMLKRLTPPSTLAVEGSMPDTEWQSRADTAGVPMRRPSGDDVLVELACDPLP